MGVSRNRVLPRCARQQIFLQTKNRLKISLLITKLSISRHIYVRYVIIRNISFNLSKIKPQSFAKRFKMFFIKLLKLPLIIKMALSLKL